MSVKNIKSQNQNESIIDQFYNVHKVLYDDITGKNYKPPTYIKISGSDLEKMVSSYWKELKSTLIQFIKTQNIKHHSIFSDYINSFVPFYKWRASKEKLTQFELIRLAQIEFARVNKSLYNFKELKLEGFDYQKLDSIISNYFNKLQQIIDINNITTNYKEPESTDFMEDKFNKLLNKSYELYNQKFSIIDTLSEDKKKQLSLIRNKLALIKTKGFDVNNELTTIINNLKSI